MSPTIALFAFGLGAAGIALWTVSRFQRFGPQTVTGSLVVAAATFVVQTPLLGLVSPAVAKVGVGGALLLVVLPSLALLFWSCGCLIRSLVTLAAPYRR